MSELKPRITENGIDYILVGDYYIPDLKLPEEHRPYSGTPSRKSEKGLLLFFLSKMRWQNATPSTNYRKE